MKVLYFSFQRYHKSSKGIDHWPYVQCISAKKLYISCRALLPAVWFVQKQNDKLRN